MVQESTKSDPLERLEQVERLEHLERLEGFARKTRLTLFPQFGTSRREGCSAFAVGTFERPDRND
jgi:hypothetical protein